MDPDSYVAMSGIQHFCFCRRQWALIHLEQQWAENLRTAEGHLLHERCHDEALHEKRGGLLTVRGLWKRVVQCSPIYGILSPKAELWCEGTADRKSPAASHLSVLLKHAGCASKTVQPAQIQPAFFVSCISLYKCCQKIAFVLWHICCRPPRGGRG